MVNVCTCGKPTKDEAYVCEDCLSDLFRALGECPWLDEELEVTITRQRGAATTGGANSGETALPWHDKASEAKRELHTTLVAWVRACAERRVVTRGGSDALPVNTIPTLSRWLMSRVDGLAFHEDGYKAVDEVTRAVKRGQAIVFFKPEARRYLGRCDVEFEDTGSCGGDIYAEPDDVVGYCQVCAEPFAVEGRREAMEAELDDRLYTAAEIAHLATYLGLDVSRERVRKQVNTWHSKKQIGSHSGVGANARFRYGTVRVMLYQQFATKAG